MAMTTFEKKQRALARKNEREKEKKRLERERKKRERDERRFLRKEKKHLVKPPVLENGNRTRMDLAIEEANRLREENEGDYSTGGLFKLAISSIFGKK